MEEGDATAFFPPSLCCQPLALRCSLGSVGRENEKREVWQTSCHVVRRPGRRKTVSTRRVKLRKGGFCRALPEENSKRRGDLRSTVSAGSGDPRRTAHRTDSVHHSTAELPNRKIPL